MKRRRYDSDSDEDAPAQQQQQVAPAVVAAPPIPAPTTGPMLVAPASVFSEGTLFSKGKRTQLASDLASRPEADWSAAMGMVGASSAPAVASQLGGVGGGPKSSPMLTYPTSSSEHKLSLLEELELGECAAAAALRGEGNTPRRRADDDFGLGRDSSNGGSVSELLPLAASSASPHHSPALGSAGNPLLNLQQQASSAAAASATANGLSIIGSYLSGGGYQPQRPHVIAVGSAAAAAVAARQVPVGLPSIRGYLSKGLRPQMNCRIQDDEIGRSGVWLPQTAAMAAANNIIAERNSNNANGNGSENNTNSSNGGGSSGNNKAAAASTVLSVRPLQSDRLQPILDSLIATTGPIRMDILRSHKSAPDAAEEAEKLKAAKREERLRRQAEGGNNGGADNEGEDGDDGNNKADGEGGGDHPHSSRCGLRTEGHGRGGRGRGGRGGSNANHYSMGGSAEASSSLFGAADEPKDVVRHIDVGGGGLQHPYFNSYCNTILKNVAVCIDAGVPAGVATTTSPTSAGPVGGFPAVSTSAAAASSSSSSAIPPAISGDYSAAPLSEDKIVPALTILSHSLRTRDVVSMYCGGIAPKTARPARRTAADGGADGAGGIKSPTHGAAGIAHSSATKPHEYVTAPQLGNILVRSGWRWDGIVRGNPRMLAKYAADTD